MKKMKKVVLMLAACPLLFCLPALVGRFGPAMEREGRVIDIWASAGIQLGQQLLQVEFQGLYQGLQGHSLLVGQQGGAASSMGCVHLPAPYQ